MFGRFPRCSLRCKAILPAAALEGMKKAERPTGDADQWSRRGDGQETTESACPAQAGSGAKSSDGTSNQRAGVREGEHKGETRQAPNRFKQW
jgi:hypothetical protein